LCEVYTICFFLKINSVKVFHTIDLSNKMTHSNTLPAIKLSKDQLT